jgi:hypothetical protein
MTLAPAIQESFSRSFGLFRDLARSLNATALGSRLPGVRSNSIGSQLWCVVGARESYSRAIAAGAWSGFGCSLEDTRDPVAVVASLESSEAKVRHALRGLSAASDAQARLFLDLLEHEAAHQGQLIRYLYALGLTIPDSWRDRYALD